jgi:hypothetical protein
MRKGEAKMQFLACYGRIAELKAAGLDIRAIYERLLTEKLVTMSYTGFYDNFSKRRQKKPRKKRPSSLQAPSSPSPAPALTLVSPSQAKGKGGWSLDEKVAALNAEAERSGKKRASGSELDDFSKSEIF